ncbi:ABC transporter permease [Clostridium niameyense]|uniref:ABC transporter permease n=1 Tax=Clostridium niameyense TaxID=1622073 RepID=A0A6M0RAC0_9CLOT|nr:ABC transporter permease [Clostridium niameyense]NEZ46158.1 ABC transporter permease [Clostridium niameyense]
MKKHLIKIKNLSSISKISFIIIIFFTFMALFCPLICKFPYSKPSGVSFNPPCSKHILGTDDLGIDLWSQICYGSRISITVGLFTALLSGLLGSFIGIVCGYYGGTIDKILMRFTDLMMVLPELPVMIVLAAFFGPSIKNVIIVLSLFSWVSPSRIIRSKVISIKNENYIKVAQSFGGNFTHILSKHILPKIIPLISISMIKIISKSIIAESSLSFLGLGDPLSKSWGMILNHAINFEGIYFTDYWKWWILSPLTCILTLVLAFAFISKELENI